MTKVNDKGVQDNTKIDRRITDPFAYGEFGYPWEEWDYIRSMDMLYKCKAQNFPEFWAITKYADIVSISQNSNVFSGKDAPAIRSADRVNVIGESRRMLPDLLELEGSEHRFYRRIVIPAFSNSSVRSMAGDLDNIVNRVVFDLTKKIDDISAGKGHVDIVEYLSRRVPTYVICQIMGVPEDEIGYISDLTSRYTETVEAGSFSSYEEAGIAQSDTLNSMLDYFEYLAKSKRDKADQSLTSYLANSLHDGRVLTDSEINALCHIIFIGGNDTTKHAITGGIQAFHQFPEQFIKLRKKPELIDSAVDEIFRWTSPTIHFNRVALADARVGRTDIKKGDNLALFYPAANRDPAYFKEPNDFDICRSPNKHLAFGGFGVHFCIGAALAKAELAVVFSKLANLFEVVDVLQEKKMINSLFFGGYKNMQVSLE